MPHPLSPDLVQVPEREIRPNLVDHDRDGLSHLARALRLGEIFENDPGERYDEVNDGTAEGDVHVDTRSCRQAECRGCGFQ